VTALRQLARAMLAAGSPGPHQDLDAIVTLNRQFHARLVSIAGQPAMAAALAGAVHPPIVLRNFHTYDDESLHRSLAHHLEIVAAISAGDPVWARAVMTAHIRNARAVMLAAAPA
jgi:DNA-binding GntR family transcriptional regulator